MNAAVQVGRLAHQGRDVLRGCHIEEWAPVYVCRLHGNGFAAHRYLIVADAIIVQIRNLMEGVLLVVLLLLVVVLRLLWLMVYCVLVLCYLN